MIKLNTGRGVEDISTEDKLIMRDERENKLWYVTFAPLGSTIKEKFVRWVVGKWAPHWDLIEGSKTVDIPFIPEELGFMLAQSEKERKERLKIPKTSKTMVLRLPEKQNA